MKTSSIFLTAGLLAQTTFVTAAPAADGVNQPITDQELDFLKGIGATQKRSPDGVNEPITKAEREFLQGIGAAKRSVGDSGDPLPQVNVPMTEGELEVLDAIESDLRLEARGLLNCGHAMNGRGGSNGKGKWVPWQTMVGAAESFCTRFQGTDIFQEHQTSHTYEVSLTNQKNKDGEGADGYLVLGIYNTGNDKIYTVRYQECYDAMIKPIEAQVKQRTKRGVDDEMEGLVFLGKRDNCWGKKNEDYEGGWWKVDGVATFGSMVFAY